MRYTLNVPFIKRTGKVIGIVEYCLDDKWYKPKRKIGTEEEPLTDDVLNDFIEQILPEELCLSVIDKKNEYRTIDFALEDLENIQ